MIRSGFAAPKLKQRKCPVCKEPFMQERKGQSVCSADCVIARVSAKKSRRAKKAAAEEAKRTKAQKEALKTIPKLIAEAQEQVNRYVRFRDAGKGCFVCGTTLILGGVGGGFDAGHIRSRSNAGHLRFDSRNIFGECKPCNAPGSTKDHEMKAAAIRMLGEKEAEALYADNTPHKWTADELREIRDSHRIKARELERQLKG